MQITLYTTDRTQTLSERRLDLAPDVKQVENKVINLYPEIRCQTLEGFGGAVTDAAGSVYAQMNARQKQQMMETYFAPTEMGYAMVRIHMDSCDFSTGMYEAMSDPNDHDLTSFSFARTEQYILPMLEDAQKAAGRPLELMLTPWSPPAFMKTNQSRTHGGKLLPQYRDLWASYLCRYIKEFQRRGFYVKRISIQNETNAIQTWDSCLFTAQEEKAFLRDHLMPTMKAQGLEDVEVFIWDHNKERAYERVRDTIDEDTKDMVAGVACHWYSGDHFEVMDMIHQVYPDLKMIISESCIEYSNAGGVDPVITAGRLAHELMGDLNHGACAFYDWNLLLDELGGPNHVNNYCHAPFLYDRTKQELCPQLLQTYFYHFAHFLPPQSVRIGCSRYTDKVDVTAFATPDGKLTAVFLNRTLEEQSVALRLNGDVVSFVLPAESITTGVIG